ncbi:TadE/TadG family type IV pilus assembly protein, partial [Cellulomonas iranensis]|uniref:TadE/TadG family type IV pilus assembly protein n=1 Tax=Cellulomonas iranensis TaxID=76862 RepID=UPI00277D08CB
MVRRRGRAARPVRRGRERRLAALRRLSAARLDDAGAAVVDFTLVGGLVVVLFVAVVQLALVQHVRNTCVDAAAEGARYAAHVGRAPADGAAR